MLKRKVIKNKKSDKYILNAYGVHPTPAVPAVKSNINI